MTFTVTIPMWAIDTFMVLGCIGCILGAVKTALEIYLAHLKRKKFY